MDINNDGNISFEELYKMALASAKANGRIITEE
jgi:hypothetical protein